MATRRKTRRKSRLVEKDWLSELPESLIIHILGFLPTTDVVRTPILSKRWKNLWTTIPCLDFVETAKIRKAKFGNFVDGAINSWRGVKIVRFGLEFDSLATFSDVDSWVHFAVEKKVEEFKLFLSLRYKTYLLPQCLYSCSSLQKLWLKNCDLQIHGDVHWDQLKVLKIVNIELNEDAVNKVLLGSPNLLYLNLTLFESSMENLTIRSNSLKWLQVGLHLLYEAASSMHTEMRIWTPNLTTFYLCGVLCYKKLLLMDVTSLTRAFLLIANPSWPQWINNFVGAALFQILPIIKHVERLTLSDSCIEILGLEKEMNLLSIPFPNAKFLELKIGSQEFERIVLVVEMFPELRNLVLDTSYRNLRKDGERRLKFDRNFPSSFLSQLRRVDVTRTRGDDSIFQLIQFFLKYARNLENMVLREKGIESQTSWKSASQKLLRMEKSSPKAKLIFC